jgi:dTMP kinase
VFLSVEGIDFSGKTTQIARLADRLRGIGHEVLLVREPGGTAISERIRDLLLDTRHANMDAVTELLLFSAARSQLVRETILPALERGAWVIADRFFDSSTAYQGYGRGIDIERVLSLHQLAAHALSPDRTIVLDISVDESLARRALRTGRADRMESADAAFFQRVREGYHDLAQRFSTRIALVDGMGDVEEVERRMFEAVQAIPERRTP